MLYVTKHLYDTLEVKQSKFIAHLFPYSDFEKILAELKQQHPKARHFVTAYRYLNEFGQIVEGSSDDGEPRGTSGKPTLMVLQGKELVEVGVVTVRYFGGTKLGTGGLVRAYGDALNLVLQKAELKEYKKEAVATVMVAYDELRRVEYELQKAKITITHKEFMENVKLELKAPKELLEEVLSTLNGVTHIPHR